VVAVVNNDVITWSELYRMMESEASEQVKALDEQERMKAFRDNEALFLEKLIDMRLQIQEAKRFGIVVSQQDIQETIENIKKKYSLTEETLKESLKKEGLTLEEYKKKLYEQILIGQLVNQQIRSKIIISDEDVRKHIEANKELMPDGEMFKIRQILLKQPKEGTDQKQKQEEKASRIIEKLKAGEDFSAIAREYSEEASAKQGGDLGYVKKSLLAKEFLDVLSTMKPGDVSEPFWTERGLHIIRLDEVIAKKDLNESKENIKRQLVDMRFLEQYRNWIKGLRETARIEIRL
jgi:peptidyl-prolyl cis-trans isomerase SurA